ncbi:MAG: hypothetical protein M1826_005618 [Phylliscum demangeonii]|nr:MAG: hypothetical protein M1826_005618 [Phylliscum demangeonii]
MRLLALSACVVAVLARPMPSPPPFKEHAVVVEQTPSARTISRLQSYAGVATAAFLSGALLNPFKRGPAPASPAGHQGFRSDDAEDIAYHENDRGGAKYFATMTDHEKHTWHECLRQHSRHVEQVASDGDMDVYQHCDNEIRLLRKRAWREAHGSRQAVVSASSNDDTRRRKNGRPVSFQRLERTMNVAGHALEAWGNVVKKAVLPLEQAGRSKAGTLVREWETIRP